ncbi:MAG: ATP-binding protein [Solirubrobacteraceae bacterium]
MPHASKPLRASPASPEPSNGDGGCNRLLHLPAEPEALSTARQYLSETALSCGLEGTDHYQFLYAVNEALTNAIKHGIPDGLGMITLGVAQDSLSLTATVYDPGHASTISKRATDNEGGRGLGLMLAMTDALNIQSDESGTTVSLTKRLPGELNGTSQQRAESAVS